MTYFALKIKRSPYNSSMWNWLRSTFPLVNISSLRYQGLGLNPFGLGVKGRCTTMTSFRTHDLPNVIPRLCASTSTIIVGEKGRWMTTCRRALAEVFCSSAQKLPEILRIHADLRASTNHILCTIVSSNWGARRRVDCQHVHSNSCFIVC